MFKIYGQSRVQRRDLEPRPPEIKEIRHVSNLRPWCSDIEGLDDDDDDEDEDDDDEDTERNGAREAHENSEAPENVKDREGLGPGMDHEMSCNAAETQEDAEAVGHGVEGGAAMEAELEEGANVPTWQITRHRDAVMAVAWSADGVHVATGGCDDTAYISDWRKGVSL
jgi:hypothetical protein